MSKSVTGSTSLLLRESIPPHRCAKICQLESLIAQACLPLASLKSRSETCHSVLLGRSGDSENRSICGEHTKRTLWMTCQVKRTGMLSAPRNPCNSPQYLPAITIIPLPTWTTQQPEKLDVMEMLHYTRQMVTPDIDWLSESPPPIKQKRNISEWPFILSSVRHTCAIMLSN